MTILVQYVHVKRWSTQITTMLIFSLTLSGIFLFNQVLKDLVCGAQNIKKNILKTQLRSCQQFRQCSVGTTYFLTKVKIIKNFLQQRF